MSTIDIVSDSVKKLVHGFEDEVKHCLVDNIPVIEGYIRNQLFHGIDGSGKQISPSYLNDPFFKSATSGRWKNNAKGYMFFKNHVILHPSYPNYLNLPPKNKQTPDLYIRGDFHRSIKAKEIQNGIEIGSEGLSFSGSIEKKYGNLIYALSPRAKEIFIQTKLMPRLISYVNKFK